MKDNDFRYTTLVAKGDSHYVEIAKSRAFDVASIIENAVRENFPTLTVCTRDYYEPEDLDEILKQEILPFEE